MPCTCSTLCGLERGQQLIELIYFLFIILIENSIINKLERLGIQKKK